MQCFLRSFALIMAALALAPAARAQAPSALTLSGEFHGVHDPSIMQQGNRYYVFATGAAVPPRDRNSSSPSSPSAPSGVDARAAEPQLPIRCSDDLHAWTRCGAVFPAGIPQWIRQASPETHELWAPDISLYDGIYHLYYAYSAFGKNTSGIGLATNRTLDAGSPDYKWEDQGLVLASHAEDKYNAIDPNLVLDEHGDAWLAFGSFWSGIKMCKLDRATGKPSTKNRKLYALATRAKPKRLPGAKPGLPPDWQAVEAPFVFHHGDYYYLFVSWDLCCRGANSTYHTMVGRSRSVHGPFVDRDGKRMSKGGGTPVLVANQHWVGPGGESVLHTTQGDIMVYHAYDATRGRPALQISTIDWAGDWPAVALGGGSQ